MLRVRKISLLTKPVLVVRTKGLPHDFDIKEVKNDCLINQKGKIFFKSNYKGRKIKRLCKIIYADKELSLKDLTLVSVSVWSPFFKSKKQYRFKRLVLRFI